MVLTASVWLTGCGGVYLRNRLNLSPAQWQGILAERGVDPTAVENPLEPSEELGRAALAFAGGGTASERLGRLQDALFDTRHFTFDYDARSTYTARDAFARRRGNCVAFTNLFIAMARAIGIPVQAGFLARGQTEKEGDLVFLNQHVVAVHVRSGRFFVYDFYRLREGVTGGVVPIDDLMVSGIFFNNLGVESLRQGRLAEARELVVTATKVAPDFAAAHGNLGVILRRLGDEAGALAAYRRALEIAPRDPGVLSNLASLYTSTGRHREARAVMFAIEISEANPYTLLVRGDLELASGRIDEALKVYRRAHRLEPRIVEPLLAIARAEQARRNTEGAKKALRKALDLQPNNEEARRLLQGLLPSERPRGSLAGGSDPVYVL